MLTDIAIVAVPLIKISIKYMLSVFSLQGNHKSLKNEVKNLHDNIFKSLH